VVALYLEFLARFKDSHIERKLGTVAAQRVRLEARRLVERLDASASAEMDAEDLARFDRSLKSRGINPGTSADLTVATLLAGNLLQREGQSRRGPTSAGRDRNWNYVKE
jgi:triphosphoribosyl-dephospho-CoA synthase